MSPIRAVACHQQAELIPAPALGAGTVAPVEVFASGIEAPTFVLLNQPVPEIDVACAPGMNGAACPAFAEYIEGADSTATQQMLKYVRSFTYQAGPIGEADQGKVAPNNDQAALAAYLKANANIDARDPEYNGYTALHHAAATGRMDLIALLIAFGANIDCRDYDGNKAEDVAREAAKNEGTNMRWYKDEADGHFASVDQDKGKKYLECMHCLVQAKQAKDRTRRYLDVGYLEFPTAHGCSSGVVS